MPVTVVFCLKTAFHKSLASKHIRLQTCSSCLKCDVIDSIVTHVLLLLIIIQLPLSSTSLVPYKCMQVIAAIKAEFLFVQFFLKNQFASGERSKMP